MTFGEFRNTEEYIVANIIELVDTNGEKMDIDNLNDEVLQNIEVVDTYSDGGYLEITLN